ncbi:MAG TPA: VTT domain-containing protein, partial [Beijerinckiaceae bacterium]|nr:VTT domain-containing protein [Beijerinckiaceae bacterium]
MPGAAGGVAGVTDVNEHDRRTGARALTRVLLAVLIVATIAVVATGTHEELKLENLIARRDDLRAFVAAHEMQALGLYVLVYVGVVALSVPGAVFVTIFGGFLFGWLVGGLAAILSAIVGSIIVFLIASTALGDVLVQRAGPRLRRLADGFREDAFSYLLFLRLTPLFPLWLVNLAPALFGVPLK